MFFFSGKKTCARAQILQLGVAHVSDELLVAFYIFMIWFFSLVAGFFSGFWTIDSCIEFLFIDPEWMMVMGNKNPKYSWVIPKMKSSVIIININRLNKVQKTIFNSVCIAINRWRYSCHSNFFFLRIFFSYFENTYKSNYLH